MCCHIFKLLTCKSAFVFHLLYYFLHILYILGEMIAVCSAPASQLSGMNPVRFWIFCTELSSSTTGSHPQTSSANQMLRLFVTVEVNILRSVKIKAARSVWMNHCLNLWRSCDKLTNQQTDSHSCFIQPSVRCEKSLCTVYFLTVLHIPISSTAHVHHWTTLTVTMVRNVWTVTVTRLTRQSWNYTLCIKETYIYPFLINILHGANNSIFKMTCLHSLAKWNSCLS